MRRMRHCGFLLCKGSVLLIGELRSLFFRKNAGYLICPASLVCTVPTLELGSHRLMTQHGKRTSWQLDTGCETENTCDDALTKIDVFKLIYQEWPPSRWQWGSDPSMPGITKLRFFNFVNSSLVKTFNPTKECDYVISGCWPATNIMNYLGKDNWTVP